MNPSTKRSVTSITKALFDLMNLKHYKQITITEIARLAGVVRNTFYRHFESKDDVLLRFIKSINNLFLKELRKQVEVTAYSYAKLFFDIMYYYRKFVMLIKDNDLFYLLTDESKNIIQDLDDDLKDSLFQGYDETFIQFYHSYNTAGMYAILENWIENDFDKSSHELALIYQKMIHHNPQFGKDKAFA